jgi:DNA-3-methyladenine glycosylase
VPPGPRLPRSFFERSCLSVGPELVGCYLMHRIDDGPRLVGRIVEVEAYLGDRSDPGSHTHNGRTPRNRAMFGPPGRLYVYRSYGIHICANVVCEAEGRGAAVLLRAVEPVAGIASMRSLRGLGADAPLRDVATGPGRLGQAFGLSLDDYAASLLRGRFGLHAPGARDAAPEVAVSRRIGLSKGAELPYRFYDAASGCVTPARNRGASRSRLRRARPR